MKSCHVTLILACLCPHVWAQDVHLLPDAPALTLPEKPKHTYGQVTKPTPELRLAKVGAPAIKAAEANPLSLPNRSAAPVKPDKTERVRMPVIVMLAATWKPAHVEALRPLSSFRVKLLTRWDQPHGEMMQTMLSQIEAAEKAGDSAAYKRLTETYTTWAEKYLVRDTKPDIKQTP